MLWILINLVRTCEPNNNELFYSTSLVLKAVKVEPWVAHIGKIERKWLEDIVLPLERKLY